MDPHNQYWCYRSYTDRIIMLLLSCSATPVIYVYDTPTWFTWLTHSPILANQRGRCCSLCQGTPTSKYPTEISQVMTQGQQYCYEMILISAAIFIVPVSFSEYWYIMRTLFHCPGGFDGFSYTMKHWELKASWPNATEVLWSSTSILAPKLEWKGVIKVIL